MGGGGGGVVMVVQEIHNYYFYFICARARACAFVFVSACFCECMFFLWVRAHVPCQRVYARLGAFFRVPRGKSIYKISHESNTNNIIVSGPSLLHFVSPFFIKKQRLLTCKSGSLVKPIATHSLRV